MLIVHVAINQHANFGDTTRDVLLVIRVVLKIRLAHCLVGMIHYNGILSPTISHYIRHSSSAVRVSVILRVGPVSQAFCHLESHSSANTRFSVLHCGIPLHSAVANNHRLITLAFPTP